jgi:hypothetical protein
MKPEKNLKEWEKGNGNSNASSKEKENKAKDMWVKATITPKYAHDK